MAWGPFKSQRSKLIETRDNLARRVAAIEEEGFAAAAAGDDGRMAQLGVERFQAEAQLKLVLRALEIEEQKVAAAIRDNEEAQRRAAIRAQKAALTQARHAARDFSDAAYRFAAVAARYEQAMTAATVGLPPALKFDFSDIASPARRRSLLDHLLTEAFESYDIDYGRTPTLSPYTDRRTGKAASFSDVLEQRLALLRLKLDPSETGSVPSSSPQPAPEPPAEAVDEPEAPPSAETAPTPAPAAVAAPLVPRYPPLSGETVDFRGQDLGIAKHFDAEAGEFVADTPPEPEPFVAPPMDPPPKPLRLPRRKAS